MLPQRAAVDLSNSTRYFGPDLAGGAATLHQRRHHRVGSMSVPVRRRICWRGAGTRCCRGEGGAGFDEDVPAEFHCFDPFGLWAHRGARYTEQERFLLQSSRVSDDAAGVHDG